MMFPVALPALRAPDNDVTDLLDPINYMYMTHAIHLLIFIMGIALRAGYEIPYWEIIVVGFFHMAYTMALVEINRAAVKNNTQAP
ncbi:hypothetical protein SLS55_008988 [Diplodia seriata]|uniref:Uncharacterized protein n=1 Tax=Diplodia seriata TaxID=420778 RepID=A0ABR3C7K2_9PEZI